MFECFFPSILSHQTLLGGGPGDREEVFDALVREKARVDHLNVNQLLRRDLKVPPRVLIMQTDATFNFMYFIKNGLFFPLNR